MKRWRRTFGMVVAMTLMTVSMCGGASAKEVYRLSNQLPPSHYVSRTAEVFAERVKEYSGGEIEIKIFHSAQLFKDTEIVEAIQEGLVEIGLVPVNKWSGMIPAADIFGMPFLFSGVESLGNFLQAGAGELLDGEFQKFDTKVLFWVDYGFVQYLNSVRPLRAPEDFKGLKIRSFSSGSADTVSALGGTPVVMSSSEMYMALQRGTVDGATTGIPAAVSRKLFEVQKYLTVCNYSAAEFVVQANLEWWDDLPEKTKQVLLKAGADASEWVRGEIGRSETKALQTLEEKGMEIDHLTSEEKARLTDATAPVRNAFVEKSGDLGKKLMEIANSID